ncbi:IPT/TIG domain-containing protein [Glycomyces sp. NPDC046736]|uniref:phage tail tube protein n=1 Tax=Glycomyces sp. NPDC046736 TaxID=3155615 RepID=UPI00340EA32D
MSNETALARRYIFQIDTAWPHSGTDVWEQLPGMTEFKDGHTHTDQRDSDYDSDGAIGYTRTAKEWLVEQKISYKEDDLSYAVDPVHAYLKSRAEAHAGRNTVVHFRYFDRNGGVDAYEGYGLPTWTPDGGDDEQLDRVAITYKPWAQNPHLVRITNPLTLSPVPLITSVAPSTGPAAGGTLVHIAGSHFTDTETVEFGASNEADFTVVSDHLIVAVTPAVAASTVRVIVTNGNGASVDNAFDSYVFA